MGERWKKNGLDGRAWLHCTKWTSKEALILLDKAIKTLKTFGYEINIDGTSENGFGSAHVTDDGTMAYFVGIHKMLKTSGKALTTREALGPTVACFHEVFGHGGQWRNEIQKDTPLSKILLLNDIACRNSNDYYGAYPKIELVLPRYFEQPHEIAAQYMRLKMCQKFLSTIYGFEKADNLLCEYVNLRIIGHSEFVTYPDGFCPEPQPYGRTPYVKHTEPFQKMEAVYSHFRETFVKQVFGHIDYVVPKRSDDSISEYINNQKLPWKRSSMRKQINNISDRLTQTYVIASLWLEQHSEWSWVKNTPAFCDMEFPTEISSLIRGAPEPPKESELDLSQLTEERLDLGKALKRLEQETRQQPKQL